MFDIEIFLKVIILKHQVLKNVLKVAKLLFFVFLLQLAHCLLMF